MGDRGHLLRRELESALPRFLHGIRRVAALFSVLRSDRRAWSRYLRVCSIQAVVTLAVAGLAIASGWLSSDELNAYRAEQREAAESAAPPPRGPSISAAPTASAPRSRDSRVEPDTDSAAPIASPPPRGPLPAPATDSAAPIAPAPPGGALPGPATDKKPRAPDTGEAPRERSTRTAPERGEAPAGEPADVQATGGEEFEKNLGAVVARIVREAERQGAREKRRAATRQKIAATSAPDDSPSEAEADDGSSEADEDASDVSDELRKAIDAAQSVAKNGGRGAEAVERATLPLRIVALQKASALLEQTGEDGQKLRKFRGRLRSALPGLRKETSALPDGAERTRLLGALDGLDAFLVRTREHNPWRSLWALVLSIYATLGVVQAGVIALSRDFHDAITRDLSLRVRVAPEDPDRRPRIRLDVTWLRNKFNRRFRGLLAFLPGTAVIAILARLFPFPKVVTAVFATVWAGYWFVLFTAAQTARAWTPIARPPWYLRLWMAGTERVFFLRPLRGVGRLWTRLSQQFYGPAACIEAQPAEFSGLSLVRALTLIPVVKLFLRPVLPVAAAQVLLDGARSPNALPAELLARQLPTPASEVQLSGRD